MLLAMTPLTVVEGRKSVMANSGQDDNVMRWPHAVNWL